MGIEGIQDNSGLQAWITALVRNSSYVNNVINYGAVGDGVTDDTSSIQQAIDSCEDGGVVYIPSGIYKITDALNITGNITIRGESVSEVWGKFTDTYAGLPGSSPWVVGSVILQSTLGKNGINIVGTGKCVNIYNIAIRFDDSIAFNSTGHGIYAVPTDMSGLGHEMGISGCRWDNVIVFGHDGDHYAFYSYNMILATITHIRGYGGGGWYMYCDSAGGNFGNTVVEHAYFALIVRGSAHGYLMKAVSISTPGVLNMVVFVRPQCNISTPYGGVAVAWPGILTPTNSQYLYKDEGNPCTIYLISPDFETSDAIASPISFGWYTYCEMKGGYFSFPNGVIPAYRSKKPFNGTPTISLWGGAGLTGVPTASVKGLYAASSNDERGWIEFTTGTDVPAGDTFAIMTVTLQSWLSIGLVSIQPMITSGGSRITLDAGLYMTGITANSFDVWAHTQLSPNTTYAFSYYVVE